MPNEEVKMQNFNNTLRVTLDLYLKYGITNTTKEMIAKETGLSVKTISRYFPSKIDCTIRVAEWVMMNIRIEINSHFYESIFTDGKHTGAQLLAMYMEEVKKLFFRDPRYFVLYSEYKLYIYRNCEDFEQEYTMLLNTMGSHRLRKNIYNLGKKDGTLPKGIDIFMEEEYFTESFLGFLSNLAMSFNSHSNEDLERMIDQRIDNTIALYTGGKSSYRASKN